MTGALTVTHAVQDFIEQGGPVLWLIFAACLLLWLLILERAWYMRITWPGKARQLVRQWNERQDCASWRAKKIREATISEAQMTLHALLPLIQMLVALCPLLGLLGTVQGATHNTIRNVDSIQLHLLNMNSAIFGEICVRASVSRRKTRGTDFMQALLGEFGSRLWGNRWCRSTGCDAG